ncbi:protein-disulfide reductase DsbD domain-containing protein [Rudaea sp.]|uniref:protein-disulfide reductase DsbD domain-containing protein n=1 Tax=Rudaea sp. TaxID=2136325 RepID=UPI002ED23550
MSVAHAAPVASEHIEVELVSENSALVPGQTAHLGLRLKHEPGWHTYWTNPGDSGLPTKLSWTLPRGFSAGEIAWPAPTRFKVDDLYNFGYTGEVVLPVALAVPANATTGSNVALAVEAKWLVCHEVCVPGKAQLKLDVPVATKALADPRYGLAFAQARLSTPLATLPARARIAGEHVTVTLATPGLSFVPDDALAAQKQIVASTPPRITRQGETLIVDFAKSEYFTGEPAGFDLVLTSRAANEPVWQGRAVFSNKNAVNSPAPR